MRARPLVLDERSQAGDRFELFGGDVLRTQVCLFVRDEVSGELLAVLPQEATSEELVDVVELKVVRPDQRNDVTAQSRRVAQPFEDGVGDSRSRFRVSLDMRSGLARS